MSTPRRKAREAALQILYFWEIGGAAPQDAIDAFFLEHDPDASDAVRAFASDIVQGTITELAALDGLVEQHTRHWRLERLAVIDRLILRMGVWELRHARDIPAAVVMNESVELARRFSTDEAVRFVNGVLDGVHKSLEDEPAR